MNTLIIYDNTGYIISITNISPREPIGLPFLWVDIPQTKQLKITDGIGIDVTVTPNVPILEDIPETDMQKLLDKVQALDLLQQQQNEALQEASNILKTSGLDSIDALFAVMDRVRKIEVLVGGVV